jgi:hypothetical protein
VSEVFLMMVKIFAYLSLMAFMALAPVLHAQPAMNLEANQAPMVSTLPLRNLLIEVRQISASETDDSQRRLRGEARLESDAASAQLDIQGNARQRSDSVTSKQQVLVLNGRSARIGLRNSVPFWLVQTVFHNGAMIVVPSVVMLEAGTGFNAVPRWDGQGSVELTVSAAQSQGRYSSQATSTAAVLMVELGDWVTVAQSDQQSMGASSGGLGFERSRQTQGTQVQIRVTVR